MNPHTYLDLKKAITERGYGRDIQWAENMKQCDNADDFCTEYIFVVVNSGMKAQIAVTIFQKIMKAISEDRDIAKVFGHEGKVAAIKDVIENRKAYYQQYLEAADKIEFCKTLPWIGDITKFHLAKNLGVDCVKPDRHLVRIAKSYGTDPFTLCQRLSEATGDLLNMVDVVLWRSANLGLI